MKKVLSISVFLLLAGVTAQAQFAYGFKAGLNFSRFAGDLETNDAGMELEEFDLTTGFHVGAVVSYKFNKQFGVRGELLYSQKGVRYRYNGQSYQLLAATNGNTIVATGTKEVSINISQSYIDLPFIAYVKPTSWLEFSGGVSIGGLVGSTGAGQLTFREAESINGGAVPEYALTLEHNYYRDETGEGNFIGGSTITVDGQDIELPNAAGAYFDMPREEGSVYNFLDVGLVGGMAIYINQGFFIGGRLNYGLMDVTNEAYEFDQFQLDENNERVSRSDFDRNFSWQASIGFNF
jgi:hypothetical protein